MRYIKLLLISCLLFIFSYTFAPKTYDSFKNNILRLLENHQYTYVEEYYLKYGSSFQKDKRIYELTYHMVHKITMINIKTNVLNSCLLWRGSSIYKTGLILEYGRILMFLGENNRALKVLKKTTTPDALYYQAEIYLLMKEQKTALRLFERCLSYKKLDPVMRKKCLLRLAEIALSRGNYKKSYSLAISSKYQSIDRAILLYKIYQKSGESEKKNNILKVIKKKYGQTPKARSFLATLPVR